MQTLQPPEIKTTFHGAPLRRNRVAKAMKADTGKPKQDRGGQAPSTNKNTPNLKFNPKVGQQVTKKASK